MVALLIGAFLLFFSVLKAIENAGGKYIKSSENYENHVREELKKTAFKSFVTSVSTITPDTVKFLNIWAPNKINCGVNSQKNPNYYLKSFYHLVMPPTELSDVDGIANSEDPDETAPLGAV